jgi:Mn2+/Fe2+ NRAMP family transporter
VITYGVLGALFMPFLAITLLVLLNKRRDGALPHTEVPARWRNGWLSNSLLALCALLFVALSINELVNRVKPLLPGAG